MPPNKFTRRESPFWANNDEDVALIRQVNCGNRLCPLLITDEGHISPAYQGIDLRSVRE
jgi:hypothetical protein